MHLYPIIGVTEPRGRQDMGEAVGRDAISVRRHIRAQRLGQRAGVGDRSGNYSGSRCVVGKDNPGNDLSYKGAEIHEACIISQAEAGMASVCKESVFPVR